MAVTNTQRHDLHDGLIKALGVERAEILMEYLPPVGWADVATKQDLDALGDRLDQRIDGLDERLSSRIDRLDERLSLRIDGLDDRIDGLGSSLRSEMHTQSAELRAFMFRQQLWHTIALIGALGTLMAIFDAVP